MSSNHCQEMRLLLQADVDGELQAAEAARVAAHLDSCPDCSRLQQQLLALSATLRDTLPKHSAPEHLRQAVRARLRGAPGRQAAARRWPVGIASALVGIAASLALFAVLPMRGADGMQDWVVAAHVRALQPQHLLDVASTDRHTVKPWFAGRLSFSPPVRDLAADGFPLIGARLDSLPGSEAAVLVYRRREHVINLFIWPATAEGETAEGSRDGYNFVHWAADGMTFWAVSDLNAQELLEFAGRVR
ncbi:anti-sigma factor [Roseomonas aerophila]|uniref:Anti-sigma factor n=1 Tax=Teichococcus aerophilus TaxID=1224513 RepID=A0ABR7RGG2_9PROT|nr:anti-sigma factor [Pseudoroseomonas aerophila]MBC9205396.1 anti-sigma factor [Pseudoroseomonas aerophila]